MDNLTGRYTEYRRNISIVETKSIKDQQKSQVKSFKMNFGQIHIRKLKERNSFSDRIFLDFYKRLLKLRAKLERIKQLRKMTKTIKRILKRILKISPQDRDDKT